MRFHPVSVLLFFGPLTNAITVRDEITTRSRNDLRNQLSANEGSLSADLGTFRSPVVNFYPIEQLKFPEELVQKPMVNVVDTNIEEEISQVEGNLPYHMKLGGEEIVNVNKKLLNSVDHSLSNYLMEVLNNFKQVMKVGLSDLNIPVLDPLKPDDIIISNNKGSTKITCELNNMVVTGLSDYQIGYLNASLNPPYMKFQLSLPKLNFKGKYALKGTALGLFPLYGNGLASISVTDLKLSGEAKFKIGLDLKLTATDLKLDLDFRRILVNFENLLGGKNLGKVLNALISALGRPIFNKMKVKLLNKLNENLLKNINQQLNKFDISQIISKSA
ncbi:protein takeout-like [Tachypleus tridentatus]|uniref:protein takeout-like n=1 Tax=Tachypleus tridentatus TaxID=6853 RepID=UPI003FCF9A26